MALSEELECTGNVARDNHRGGETCDSQCRCEYCLDYAPTDAEVIADLRAKLKVRDVQLQQQNEQCQILLAKLAEVRRELEKAKQQVSARLGIGQIVIGGVYLTRNSAHAVEILGAFYDTPLLQGKFVDYGGLSQPTEVWCHGARVHHEPLNCYIWGPDGGFGDGQSDFELIERIQ